jgi:hypothetical protein
MRLPNYGTGRGAPKYTKTDRRRSENRCSISFLRKRFRRALPCSRVLIEVLWTLQARYFTSQGLEKREGDSLPA